MSSSKPQTAPVALVVPAYNEAATISDVIARALAETPLVIVVDDGSGDGTADLVAGLPVRLIRHDRNAGKGASLVTGFRAALEAGADVIVTLDGDGQHRPEDLPRLLAAARAEPDAIIVGSRLADRAAIPPSRYRANRIANFWISWACGYAVADSQSGYRVYPRRLVEAVIDRRRQPGFAYESGLLIDAARLGIRSRPVAIPALYAGTVRRASHFRPWSDITRIVLLVAGHLLARGMYPQGLVRSLWESWHSRRLA